MIYAVIAVVGVAPEIARTVGLTPLQAEATMLILLVAIAHAVAWAWERDPATRSFLTGSGWEPDGAARGLDTGARVERQLRFHTDLREG